MSAFPTFSIYCDLADIDSYAANPISDLAPPLNALPVDAFDMTSHVTHIKTKIGMKLPRQRVGDVNEMELTLDGVVGAGAYGRIYAPENALGSGLTTGRYVVVRTSDGITNRTMFKGMIQNIKPDPVNQKTVLVVVGRWFTSDAPVTLPTMTNVASHTIILAAIQAANFRGPINTALSGLGYVLPWWTISDDTFTTGGLDRMYVAGGNSDVINTSTVVFPYVLDQYINAPVRQIIEDVVNAEIGYFYEDASGVFNFLARHDRLTGVAAATFTQNDIIGQDYSYGAGLINEITMRIVARRLVTGATLWVTAVPMNFHEGLNVITIKTLGTDGRVVGLLDMPIAVNWVFTRQSNGLPVVCHVAITPAGAGVVVQVQNDLAGERVILGVGASLVGTAMILDPPMDLVQTDWVSVLHNGRRSIDYKLGLMDSVETAIDVTRFILSLYARAHGSVTYIELRNDTSALLLQQLRTVIGDLIQVQLASVGHDQLYLVAGIEQEVDMAGERIVTRFYVQPQEVGGFWILDKVGFAELDQNTRLGY